MKDVHEKRKNRDENDAFCEIVSMKLKRIKNEHARDTAQTFILEILRDAIAGKYDPSFSQVEVRVTPRAKVSYCCFLR